MRTGVAMAAVAGLLSLSAGCARFHHPGDAWWGPDKAKHLAAGFVLGAGSTYAAQEAGRNDGESVVVGMTVTAAFGAGKEVYDENVKETYWSGKDFAWSLLGGLLGSTVALSAE